MVTSETMARLQLHGSMSCLGSAFAFLSILHVQTPILLGVQTLTAIGGSCTGACVRARSLLHDYFVIMHGYPGLQRLICASAGAPQIWHLARGDLALGKGEVGDALAQCAALLSQRRACNCVQHSSAVMHQLLALAEHNRFC